MALLLGPRLGWPSASGFKVWVRLDAANELKLQTKLPSEATWTLQDTVTADATKDETAVLEATGLSAGTKYDYRILETDVAVATSYTYVMPSSGRFVVYHTSDQHLNTAGGAYASILDHWETNYEPSNIPAVILQTGDLYQLALFVADTKADAWTNIIGPALTLISDVGKACARLPLLYMWDDHDYAGNNTAHAWISAISAYGSEPDQQQAALDMWDYVWRDHPQAAAPSKAWVTTIADVPIACMDHRSQYSAHGNPGFAPTGILGTELTDAAAPLLGAAQTAWAKALFGTYADRGLMILVSPGTMSAHRASNSSLIEFTTGAARENIGVFGRGALNEIMQSAASFGWGNGGRRLVVFSGDDHFTGIWNGHAGLPGHFQDDQLGRSLAHAAHPVAFLEQKVVAEKIADAVEAVPFSTNFETIGVRGGEGYWNELPAEPLATTHQRGGRFITWDITSNNGGKRVSARVQVWRHADYSAVDTDSTGRTGDFFYQNGLFQAYDAASAVQAPAFDNISAGPPPNREFLRSYYDDITGQLVKENRVTRDYEHRLRDIDDVDEPGRDELSENFEPRVEELNDDP